MGKLKFSRLPDFDKQNISGAKLAEIGRWALMGKKIVDEENEEFLYVNDGTGTVTYATETNYTDIAWLNERIEEVCQKGKL